MEQSQTHAHTGSEVVPDLAQIPAEGLLKAAPKPAKTTTPELVIAAVTTRPLLTIATATAVVSVGTATGNGFFFLGKGRFCLNLPTKIFAH